MLTRICTLNGTVKESELLHWYHCYNICSQRLVKEGQRTLFVHTLHQRPAPPPRDLERAAARSLRLPGQTSRLLRSVRVLILTVTSRVKTWSKSITRRPHGAVASLLVNPDTHGLSQKWDFPQLGSRSTQVHRGPCEGRGHARLRRALGGSLPNPFLIYAQCGSSNLMA